MPWSENFTQRIINQYAKEKNRGTRSYIQPGDSSFEEELKSARMNPDKEIMYGQNHFAWDSEKKRIFARSSRIPDGIRVDYKDILSFELIRDGEIIAGIPTGSAGTKRTQMNTVNSNEDDSGSKIYCNELTLSIAIKDEYNPVIVMPFISYPFRVESDFLCALNAAQEIVKVLDEILLLKIEENAEGQRTGFTD